MQKLFIDPTIIIQVYMSTSETDDEEVKDVHDKIERLIKYVRGDVTWY